MKIESAKNIWENEYKPSIQMLIDNGEACYRPATILMFCAIEHAYRAIHEIPVEEPCIQAAIRWVMPYYSQDELIEQSDKWKKIDFRIEEAVKHIRKEMFNELKHVGELKDGIRIDGDKFGFMSGWLDIDDVPEGIDRKSFTIHIHGFWDMVVERIDAEYQRKLSEAVKYHEIV